MIDKKDGRSKTQRSTNSHGQVFLEFILLFAVIVGVSLTLLAITNKYIGDRWTELANKITGPSPIPRQSLRLRR